MALAVGTRLGPYEIVAPIGAGGMGEVYRARDTNLDREVAIKVLPSALAQDPERLARFEREAKVLAALNHPNIAQIYGLEQGALVMEFVDGPTLPAGLAIDAALRYARQLAEALEYAHERGVIHRDLKPANVKVSSDGVVKVLDFGLAKAVEEPGREGGDPSVSPTLTLGHTQMGVVMGTAAYMAPEQAAGVNVDRRADIWSFGAVLYEMLSGKRAFDGSSVADTLATVLKLDPDWSALPAGVPAPIRNLVRRCLTRDRKQRLQAIGEARIVLEAPAAGEPPAVEAVQRSRRSVVITAAIAAVATLALAGLSFVHFREKPPAVPAVVRFSIPLPERGARILHLSVSPNGRWVVFSGTESLWIHSLGSLDSRPLGGTEGARGTPFWSPDSRTLVFGIPGKLRRIQVPGGPAQSLCDLPGELRGGFWTRDGHLVFGTTATSGLLQVAVGGGPTAPVTATDRWSHQDPVLLPDGRHFLYLRSGNEEGGGIYLGSLDARPEAQTSKPLLADISMPGYAPGLAGGRGHIFFVREGTLLAQPFDDRALAFSGDPVPVAEQISSGSGQYSVSSTGVLVHAAGTGISGRQLSWYDREGKPGETAWTPGLYGGVALSPDASRVAVERFGQLSETWVFEFSRGASIRLTPAGGTAPAWSPDGNRIVYSSALKGGLVVKAASGAGNEDLLLKASHSVQAKDWSRDGLFLLYEDQDPKTKWDLWALPVAAGAAAEAKPIAFLNTEFNETDGQFSPDGRFVAYVSDESGRNEVYVSPFPDAKSGKWPISNGGGYQPRWRRDGKELLYFAVGGRLMSVPTTLSPAFKASAPKVLFQAPIFNGAVTTTHHWALSPDGKRFLISTVPTDTFAPLTVVLNWQAGLTK